MPMELAPGFESLVSQSGEDGIKPVGVGGIDPNAQIGSVAGNGEGISLGQGLEIDPESLQQQEPSQQLSGGGMLVRIAKAFCWAALVLSVLVLLFLWLRREMIRKTVSQLIRLPLRQETNHRLHYSVYLHWQAESFF